MILLAFLPYIISYSTGSLLLNYTIKNTRQLNALLYGILSFWLGMGISALLSFFVFLFIGHYHRWLIILFNIFLLLLLFFVNLSRGNLKNTWEPYKALRQLEIFDAAIIFIWAVLLFFVYKIAAIHPFGEWDAWGMWNLKTKFLVLSDSPWDDIFKNLIWHTHRDYPLFVPFLYIWNYSFMNSHLAWVPFTIGILAAISGSLLLYAGLKIFIPAKPAFLASLLLLAQPYYIFNATSQYADIVLALYLLLSLIMIIYAIKQQDERLGIITGLLMGITGFVKNEGIVMVVLLIGLSSLWILFSKTIAPKQRGRFFGYLLTGFCITFAAAIIFKVFMAPPSEDILPDVSISKLTLSLWQRAHLLTTFALKEMINKKWCFMWIFVLLLTLLRAKRLFLRENILLTLFFLCYAGIVGVVYIINTQTDLSWWLEYSLPRIYFCLLPSGLFYAFYIVFQEHNSKPIGKPHGTKKNK